MSEVTRRPRTGVPSLLPSRVPAHLRRWPTPSRAVRFATRWACGTASVALRYPFEAVPPRRRDAMPAQGEMPDLARPLPGDPTTLRRVADGVGPLFHRRYWIDVVGAQVDPEDLMAALVRDVNRAAPATIGRFERADGTPVGELRVGDEFLVRLPGPGNAPVRVVERTPVSFTLATLAGHIEAGEIRFRASPHPDRDLLRFEVESWARSSAALLHVLYDVVPLVRELQLIMWSRMCRNVVGLTHGRPATDVQVTTVRIPWPPVGAA